jgi:hypothetical protein
LPLSEFSPFVIFIWPSYNSVTLFFFPPLSHSLFLSLSLYLQTCLPFNTQRCQYFLDDLSVFWGPCQYKSFAQRKGKGNKAKKKNMCVYCHLLKKK